MISPTRSAASTGPEEFDARSTMTSSGVPPCRPSCGGDDRATLATPGPGSCGSWLVPVNSVSSSATVTMANLPLASTSGGTVADTATLPPNEPVASSNALLSPGTSVASRNWPPLASVTERRTCAWETVGVRATMSIGIPSTSAREVTSSTVAALTVSPPSLSTRSRAPRSGSARSSPAIMPSHRAVRRPASRSPIAWMTACLSVVGRTSTVTVSLKDTRPISTSSGRPLT